jgi:hypothetical protein
MKKSIDAVAQTVTFTFDGAEPVVFKASSTNEANRQYAILHGFSARIGDSAAMYKTEPERRAAIVGMVEHYAKPDAEWNVTKSGTKAAPQNPVVLEIAGRLGMTYEAALVHMAQKFLADAMANMPE